MSCDDNPKRRHDLAIAGGVRLPVASVRAAASRRSRAPTLWRSLEAARAPAARPSARQRVPRRARRELDGVSRRGFMQLLGVSTAVATVGAACRKPNEKIVPFVRRPEEVVPGNPLHFATAFALDGYASGLLVESHEGRPTKVEGNPTHPQTLGRHHGDRAGADPEPVRRRSRQAPPPQAPTR